MIATDAVLEPISKPPIKQEHLVAYANASGDHNPIHLDPVVAKQNGLDQVIAHGMLTMAFIGEFVQVQIQKFAPNGKLSELNCRFKAMTRLGDQITIRGKIAKSEAASIYLEIEATNQLGDVTAKSSALILLAHPS